MRLGHPVGDHAVLAVLDPVDGRRHPGAGHVKARTIDGWAGVADGDAPMLTHAGAPGPVDEDRKEPRPEGGATGEPVEPTQNGQPGLLHDLLGDGSAGDERAGDSHHRLVVSLDQREERLLLPGAQPREELVVVALRTRAAAKRGERHRCSQADPQAGRSQGS